MPRRARTWRGIGAPRWATFCNGRRYTGGMTESGKAKLAGDVDPAVAEVAGYLSPNPGGVGPMTRAMLLQNVVLAAERGVAPR